MENLNDEKGPSLDILVDSDCLYLKGTGPDIEPTLLSGHVALYLTESTSVKGVTLQFRGKARLPSMDPLTISNGPSTYIICNHDWSFLEGEKRQRRTLKAGRHLFPFQLQIGGSLPSSLATNALGGSSISYKLRARVARPGLSHNLQAMLPVSIVRSFAAEALEYQQTLEIENSWPEKLMYSIVLPHKAWAAGDHITTPVKFSSLSKGVYVRSIVTTINEMTKVSSRRGRQECNRTVATMRHTLVNGKPVVVGEQCPHAAEINESNSAPNTAGLPPSNFPRPESSQTQESLRSESDTGNVFPDSRPSSSQSSVPDLAFTETEDLPSDDVDSSLSIPIPCTAIPSHTLGPIIICYRIQWSVFIANLDGHTSELRCSLPLHVLDRRLFDEARSATAATHRALFGGPDLPPEDEEVAQLPSYPAHVQDRVANMYFPDAATIRVTNPWVDPNNRTIVDAIARSHSEEASPIETHTHLPDTPVSGRSSNFNWVNSELLLSLSGHESFDRHSGHSRAESDSQSLSESAIGSIIQRGRRRSVASSSEPSTPDSVSPSLETHIHNGTDASRHLNGLFTTSMKPFISLFHSSWPPSWSKIQSTVNPSRPSISSSDHQLRRQRSQTRHDVSHPPLDFGDNLFLLHRAFTEVPNYDISSRGFIGGVPPLSSFHGLPIYEEVESARPRPRPRTAPN